MKDDGGGRSIFWALALWVAACILAALYIPQYDMGFDGIKVYLILCAFMLAVVLTVRAFLKSPSLP